MELDQHRDLAVCKLNALTKEVKKYITALHVRQVNDSQFDSWDSQILKLVKKYILCVIRILRLYTKAVVEKFEIDAQIREGDNW